MPTKRTRNGHSKSNNNSNGKSTSKFKRGKQNNKAKPNGNNNQAGNGNGHKLTIRRKRFALLYDGNGTETARLAGYTGTDPVLGVTATEILKDPKVQAVIKERESQVQTINGAIASRQERQEFWTRVMLGNEIQKVIIGKPPNETVVDVKPKMVDRLKASEHLGKSQCDFIEKKLIGSMDDAPIEMKLSVDLLGKMDTQLLKLFQKFLSKVA